MQRFTLQSRAEKVSADAAISKPFSILFVEDNPADVGLVREALEEHGVEGELIVVSDGEEAVRAIQEMDTRSVNYPDLFIVDLNLPKRPGREIVERARHAVKSRQIPIVVLSSSDSPRDRDDALRLGADRYIQKPSRLDEFIRLGGVFKAILETAAP